MTTTTYAIPTTRSPSANAIKYDALECDVYEARIVRFIGLGVQEQRAYQGQAKDPAFKCSVQFELIGVDATGTKADGTAIEPRPACVFQDYFLFPGAKRGGVFDLCSAVDPSIVAAPRDLNWFINNLGAPIMVQVGSYQTRDGVTKNTVSAVQPMSSRTAARLDAARSDFVGFIPYADDEANAASYEKMFKFQRDMLMDAKDVAHIPYAGREVVFNKEGSAPTAPRIQPQATAPQQGGVDFDDDVPF